MTTESSSNDKHLNPCGDSKDFGSQESLNMTPEWNELVVIDDVILSKGKFTVQDIVHHNNHILIMLINVFISAFLM